MAQITGTLTELRQAIGTESSPVAIILDRTAVRMLREAVGDDGAANNEGDPVPLYGLCASMISGMDSWPPIPYPFRRGVAGGGEWEFYNPVKIGETITSTTKIVSLTEREGNSGKLYFLTGETTLRNQQGEIVSKARGTVIGYDPIL